MKTLRPILPLRIQEKIATFPEFSYGTHRVTLILDDGTEILEVFVAGSDEIIRVGTKEEFSFDITRVVDVRSEV